MAIERCGVIVIGAGFAGLSAARTVASVLASAASASSALGKEERRTEPLHVVVLEADGTRVGGRAHTVDDAAFGMVERGATWLHGTEGNPLLPLMQAAGLIDRGDACRAKRARRRRSVYACEGGGTVTSRDIAPARLAFAAVMGQAESGELPGGCASVGAELDDARRRFLARVQHQQDTKKQIPNPPDSGTAWWKDPEALARASWCMTARLQCAIEGCGTVHELDAAAFRTYVELEGRHRRVRGGFGNLPSAMALDLDVRLGHTVTVVEWNGAGAGVAACGQGGVVVTCECESDVGGASERRVFEAPAVIVAVSLGVMQRALEAPGNENAAGIDGRSSGTDGSRGWGRPQPHSRLVFNPPLPPSHADSLRRLRIGHVEKVMVKFRDPLLVDTLHLLWKPDPAAKPHHRAKGGDICAVANVGDKALWLRSVHALSRDGDGDGDVQDWDEAHCYVMTAWVTGEAACASLHAASEEELLEDLRDVLGKFFPTAGGGGAVATEAATGAGAATTAGPGMDGEQGIRGVEEGDARSEASSPSSSDVEVDETGDKDDGTSNQSPRRPRPHLRRIPQAWSSPPMVPVGVYRTDWTVNPRVLGSYSFLPVGASGEDIEAAGRPLERAVAAELAVGAAGAGAAAGLAAGTAVRLGEGTLGGDTRPAEGVEHINEGLGASLFFAGEHLARHHYSTAHGAVMSGEAAGRQVLSSGVLGRGTW